MRFGLILIVALVLSLPGCDDEFGVDPFPTVQDTATLFSVSRAELLGRASAFDFITGNTVRVELPGAAQGFTLSWDVALAEAGGGLVLVPADYFPGIDATTRLTAVADAFAAVERAPQDTAAFLPIAPIDVSTSRVYIVRTRRSGSCVYYAKLRPLEVDAEAGSVRFEYLSNPNCNDPKLQPPPEGEDG